MEFVNLEYKNEAAWLTINKAKSLNALNTTVLKEIESAIEDIIKKKPRVLFLIGDGGKAFVAGADISEMQDFNTVEAAEFSRRGHDTFRALEKLGAVTVALVDGFALGGGFELALSCDIILATENSKFGLPEVGLGLIPGFGGTQRVSRSLGLHLAKTLTFTGDMVDANFLKEKNLVYKVFSTREEMISEAESLTKKISLKGGHAISVAKKTIHQGYSLKMGEALELEKQEFALLFGAEESKEGISAFIEKRKPNF